MTAGEAAYGRDSQRYLESYEAAIHAIGSARRRSRLYEGPGISLKLSALHRATAGRSATVSDGMYRAAISRCCAAYDIGINIDAEEADRLEISLDLRSGSARAALADWNGVGFVCRPISSARRS